MSPPDEQGHGDGPPQLEEEEPAFPHTDLAKLDDMINRYHLFLHTKAALKCSELHHQLNSVFYFQAVQLSVILFQTSHFLILVKVCSAYCNHKLEI